MAVQTTTARSRSGVVGAIAARTVLTILGATGLIVGAFLPYLENVKGTRLGLSILYRDRFSETTSFFRTVGVIMIALGLVAILGLALHSGWLTRLAGALGIIAFALFAIGVYRVPGGQLIDAGAWICVAASAVALMGGFFRVPRATVSTRPTTVVPAETAVAQESS
jgi:hypothetical protein